jgi:hypothetical protein
MSTITVTGARVSNVREALDEVDAVVEALKERADVVLRMLGHEAGAGGDDATSTSSADDGGLAGAAKGAGVMLAGKALKAAAGTATGHEAKKAKRKTKRAVRRSKATPVALGDVVKGKAAELAGTTTGVVKDLAGSTSGTLKDLAGSTSGTVKGLAADLGGNAAGKAAELSGVAKGKAAELVGEALGASKAAPKRRVWPWALGAAGLVALVVVWWRMRGRVQELAAVDNTAPDEFGAVVERAELAGTIPPHR